MSHSPNRQAQFPPKIDPDLENLYLRMFAISIGDLSRNRGATRKDIWQYFQKHFNEQDYSQYQTFLTVIQHLLQLGKLQKHENNGYYWMWPNLYNELYTRYKTPTDEITIGKRSSCGKKRSAGRLSAVTPSKYHLQSGNRTYGPSISVSNPKKSNSISDLMSKPGSSGKLSKQGKEIESDNTQLLLKMEKMLNKFVIKPPYDSGALLCKGRGGKASTSLDSNGRGGHSKPIRAKNPNLKIDIDKIDLERDPMEDVKALLKRDLEKLKQEREKHRKEKAAVEKTLAEKEEKAKKAENAQKEPADSSDISPVQFGLQTPDDEVNRKKLQQEKEAAAQQAEEEMEPILDPEELYPDSLKNSKPHKEAAEKKSEVKPKATEPRGQQKIKPQKESCLILREKPISDARSARPRRTPNVYSQRLPMRNQPKRSFMTPAKGQEGLKQKDDDVMSNKSFYSQGPCTRRQQLRFQEESKTAKREQVKSGRATANALTQRDMRLGQKRRIQEEEFSLPPMKRQRKEPQINSQLPPLQRSCKKPELQLSRPEYTQQPPPKSTRSPLSVKSATPYALRSSKGQLPELLQQKKQISSRERINNVLSKTKFSKPSREKRSVKSPLWTDDSKKTPQPKQVEKKQFPIKEAMRKAVSRKQVAEQGKPSASDFDLENRSPNIKEVVAKAVPKIEEPVSNQKSSGQTRSQTGSGDSKNEQITTSLLWKIEEIKKLYSNQ